MFVHAAQDRLAGAFGISDVDRRATIAAMLARTRRGAASYWLQLVLAMGIATLGLVLGSTASVIGAMLISPLMGPLVELGMGLAVGSPFLVIRSMSRTLASVGVVVACSAVITLLLPYHEVTTEIAGRTSPTVLDLGVAIFCAVAAAYATVRAGSDATATAAGTAIGIALVPPLCVIGYGLGVGDASIALGASLLFTANFCAIILFTVLGFLALGYATVPLAALEKEELARTEVGFTVRLARSTSSFFASKLGPAVRVSMPLVLVVAVFVPLRSALVQVTWQIRVRAAIQQMLAESKRPTVHTALKVDKGRVEVRLVMLGSEDEATKLETSLRARIASVAGVTPTVQIAAVPDADALARIESSISDRNALPPPPPAHADLALLRRQAADALAGAWPERTAGALLRWRLVFATARPVIEVVHLGAPLGETAEKILAHDLSGAIGADVDLRDLALPPESVSAPAAGEAGWVSAAASLAGMLRTEPELFLCIHAPERVDPHSPTRAALADAPFRDPRIAIATTGVRWEAQLASAPCADAADGGVDAVHDASPE